jgi:hypothetical protein
VVRTEWRNNKYNSLLPFVLTWNTGRKCNWQNIKENYIKEGRINEAEDKKTRRWKVGNLLSLSIKQCSSIILRARKADRSRNSRSNNLRDSIPLYWETRTPKVTSHDILSQRTLSTQICYLATYQPKSHLHTQFFLFSNYLFVQLLTT